MSASRCGWGSWLRFLKGWGQSKAACPHSGLCCPLCTLSLWGRWGQTPRFIFPWHCVPWTGFAGSKWPGVTVADPSLGARWAHKSPLSGPQSLPHGRIQLSPHTAAEGVHFPKPPLSLSKTRGCGEIATKRESSPLSRRRAFRFTQSRPSACRYPWPRRARSPLWALFPPPQGTGMDATVPGSPQASTEGAKTRAQCGSLGPKPASRCTAPGPSAPWCYGGTS